MIHFIYVQASIPEIKATNAADSVADQSSTTSLETKVTNADDGLADQSSTSKPEIKPTNTDDGLADQSSTTTPEIKPTNADDGLADQSSTTTPEIKPTNPADGLADQPFLFGSTDVRFKKPERNSKVISPLTLQSVSKFKVFIFIYIISLIDLIRFLACLSLRAEKLLCTP